MAPLLPSLKRPGGSTWPGVAQGARVRASERAGPRPAPQPLAPAYPALAPVLGKEFSGGWGEKGLPASHSTTLPAARRSGEGAGSVGVASPLWAWPSCLPEWAAVPGAAHLLLVPLASEVALLPARALGLIQAPGTASPGRLDSEAGDSPQRRPEDTPEPVLNSDSLAPPQFPGLHPHGVPGSLSLSWPRLLETPHPHPPPTEPGS